MHGGPCRGVAGRSPRHPLTPACACARYSAVQVGDSVMLDLESGKIKDFIKYDVGNLCVITGGHNNGRVGVIVQKEKHKGSFEIVHVEDAAGNRFATRSTNVFLIGKGNKPMISLPKGKGIKLTIIQEQAKKYASA